MAVQAFEGSLRAVESGDPIRGLYAGIRAKQGVAELAESCLSRITRVIGGGSFARRSPFASWYEDVRALGFLRPPWGLAYDNLFAARCSRRRPSGFELHPGHVGRDQAAWSRKASSSSLHAGHVGEAGVVVEEGELGLCRWARCGAWPR